MEQISLIIGAVVIVGALIWYIMALKKDKKRLDKLHITGADDRKK
jgi:hypothetical protein